MVHSVGSGARLDFESLQDHMPALVILGTLYLNLYFQIHRIGMLVSVPQGTVRIKASTIQSTLK